MSPEDRAFLRDFFQNLNDRPLEPDDKFYVHLYESDELCDDDPVELLARGIEWTIGESVQLFSGYRGSGKSTELRRLRRRLKESSYLVGLIDLKEYVNLSEPIDITDFLMALCGGLSELLDDKEFLGKDPKRESYWERFSHFLSKTDVEFQELSGKAGPVDLKLGLKSDPSFKQRLQKRMSGHLGALVEDVRAYLKDCVGRLTRKHKKAAGVVLLLDSLEQLRGTSTTAEDVHNSVENLFAGHADKLRLPHLHVVYTVPPYLRVKYQDLGSLYNPGGLQVLPALKVRTQGGKSFKPGLRAAAEVVERRGDWKKVLANRHTLDQLILASGGHLRDLLRLLAEILRRATRFPVTPETVKSAIEQIRSEFLPIADEDSRWLDRVARTHRAGLSDTARLPDLARFLDTHVVLCYRNGGEWYDVHPLIRDSVAEQAEALREASQQTSDDNGQNGE